MKKFLSASIFVLAFCVVTFAQNTSDSSCPTIEMHGPSSIIEPGETATFSVDVSGAGGVELTFNWTTSTGEIIEGQGTQLIKVKIPKEGDESLVATVEVKGLPLGCESTFSEVIPCQLKPPEARMIDEFEKATNGYIKMRFDNFMIELQNDPTAQGYILNYGSPREIAKRERQIRDAVAFRKFDAQRIVVVNGGGEGEVKTQFWIVPAGATPPTP